MIDEKKLLELQAYSDWRGSSEFREVFNTLSAALKVVRAAKKAIYETDKAVWGIESHGESINALREALAPFSEEAKDK